MLKILDYFNLCYDHCVSFFKYFSSKFIYNFAHTKNFLCNKRKAISCFYAELPKIQLYWTCFIISQNRVKLHKSKLAQKWEKYPISLKWVHDLPNHNQQRISVSIEFFYTATFAKLVNNGIYKKIPKNPNIGDLVKYQAIKENSLLMNWKKLAKSIHLKRLVKRGKLKHELRVQIHEFRVQIHELQVQLVLLSFQLGLQLVTRNFVSYHITCKSMSYAL